MSFVRDLLFGSPPDPNPGMQANAAATEKVGLEGVKGAFAELGNPERHTKILVEPWR